MFQYTRTQTPGGVAGMLLLVLLPLFASPSTWASDAAETNSAVSPFSQTGVDVPVPRSLELAKAFPNSRRVWLKPLGPDDAVRYRESPPVIGRVYPLQCSSSRDGVWTSLKDGAMLWTLELTSPNAEALRVQFDPFHPPSGAELIVYNTDRVSEAYGPFTVADVREGFQFWAPTVFGPRVRVEYYLPPEVDPLSPGAPLSITGVAQSFPMPPELLEQARLGCRLDATCYAGWEVEMQAVAHIRFVKGGETLICTGAMVNRLPSADFDPLFLTAAHCIDSDTVAATAEVFWFFQTSTCNGAPPDVWSLPRTEWATHLTSDADADCSLLGLAPNEIPGGVTWAGWSSGEAPDPTGASLIHHPLGMRKSYSWGLLLGIEDISQCETASYTYDFELVDGGQDGGSSGAPVFDNSHHRIRAVATCSESDDCIPDEDTGEGSLHHAYDRLVEYLHGRTAVYVDRNTPCEPTDENGSAACPWNNILEGYYGVLGGGTIYIRGGVYPPITLHGSRAMTLQAYGGTVVIGQ